MTNVIGPSTSAKQRRKSSVLARDVTSLLAAPKVSLSLNRARGTDPDHIPGSTFRVCQISIYKHGIRTAS